MPNNETIMEIVERFGTPFYLFDKDKFVENISDMNTAFCNIYGNFQLAYSFKTNYATCICRTAKSCGMFAEVVSPMELQHAIMLGFKNIIYNGVCKTEASIAEALKRGAIINIDSLTDFRKLVIAAGHKRPKIGLRLNIDIGNGLNSRFGIVPHSDDYEKILEEADAYNIEIVGLHCHISEARSLKFWERRCDKMLDIADEFPSLRYIDMGSNLYSKMHDDLKAQFAENIPTYKDYAEVIAGRFKAHYPRENVKLILETGTPVISDTVDVVAKVVDIKNINSQLFAILDVCKFDIGTICVYKDAPIEVINTARTRKTHGTYKITGYTCIEGDVLKECYEGSLAIGSIIVFKNAGSYSVSGARNFIMPSIGMLQYSSSDDFFYVDVVKRPPCYSDVFERFV